MSRNCMPLWRFLADSLGNISYGSEFTEPTVDAGSDAALHARLWGRVKANETMLLFTGQIKQSIIGIVGQHSLRHPH